MRTLNKIIEPSPVRLLLLFTLHLSINSVCYSSKKIELQILEEKKELLEKLKSTNQYSKDQIRQFQQLYLNQPYLGQGNPRISKHPVSRRTCLKKRSANQKQLHRGNPRCLAKHMVAMKTKSSSKESRLRCIDQFEFPNLPCEYPVVWARAKTAHAICRSLGKRLCDASEWESSCAGTSLNSHINPTQPELSSFKLAHRKQRRKINSSRSKVWAYGGSQDLDVCATDSFKTKGCNEALSRGENAWDYCGSNTYPAGFFLDCKSRIGVYDQHGNVAEHMNLPLFSNQETAQKSSGYTEMKGSWFIFKKHHAHADDCFWRAPNWHGSKLSSPRSHRNYHLGFRCCKQI